MSFRVRLPATSANLGPGFDALGLALDLWLEVEASAAEDFSITAVGRNARQCESVEDSLIVSTYREVCAEQGRDAQPLKLAIDNGIPFGMGLGSSAAALLAGVAMANHFCDLRWPDERIVRDAALREGHADNVAACWFGGLTLVATDGPDLRAWAIVAPPQHWTALVAIPAAPVPTAKARAVLSSTLTRADAVFNLQRTALLTAAFAQGDGTLLREATGDRLHQPYRSEICPLLPRLMALLEDGGNVMSVTLSGAGPSVLVLVDGEADQRLLDRVRTLAVEPVEIIALCLVPVR